MQLHNKMSAAKVMHRCMHCVWIIQQTFTVQLTKVFWETKTELELYPYTIEIEHHWHCTTAKFNPYLLIRLLYILWWWCCCYC